MRAFGDILWAVRRRTPCELEELQFLRGVVSWVNRTRLVYDHLLQSLEDELLCNIDCQIADKMPARRRVGLGGRFTVAGVP